MSSALSVPSHLGPFAKNARTQAPTEVRKRRSSHLHRLHAAGGSAGWSSVGREIDEGFPVRLRRPTDARRERRGLRRRPAPLAPIGGRLGRRPREGARLFGRSVRRRDDSLGVHGPRRTARIRPSRRPRPDGPFGAFDCASCAARANNLSQAVRTAERPPPFAREARSESVTRKTPARRSDWIRSARCLHGLPEPAQPVCGTSASAPSETATASVGVGELGRSAA